MRAEAIRAFNDLKAGRVREKGESFTCSRERFEEISAKLPGYVRELPGAARSKQRAARNK